MDLIAIMDGYRRVHQNCLHVVGDHDNWYFNPIIVFGKMRISILEKSIFLANSPTTDMAAPSKKSAV